MSAGCSFVITVLRFSFADSVWIFSLTLSTIPIPFGMFDIIVSLLLIINVRHDQTISYQYVLNFFKKMQMFMSSHAYSTLIGLYKPPFFSLFFFSLPATNPLLICFQLWRLKKKLILTADRLPWLCSDRVYNKWHNKHRDWFLNLLRLTRWDMYSFFLHGRRKDARGRAGSGSLNNAVQCVYTIVLVLVSVQ